ncbi:MAG: hypothetical protein ABEJ24_05010 [Candidatus Magasanikbacteria bacterium]
MNKKLFFLVCLSVTLLAFGCAGKEVNKQAKKNIQKMTEKISDVNAVKFSTNINLNSKIKITESNSLKNIKMKGTGTLSENTSPTLNYELQLNSPTQTIKVAKYSKNTFLKIKNNKKWTKLHSSSKNNTSTRQRLNKSQIQKIKQVLRNKDIIKLEKDLGKENINGSSYLHYKVKIDPAALQHSTKQIYQIASSSIQRADLIKFSNLWGGKKLEIWINEDSLKPKKIKINSAPMPEIINEIKQTDKKADLEINFLDFYTTASHTPPKVPTTQKADELSDKSNSTIYTIFKSKKTDLKHSIKTERDEIKNTSKKRGSVNKINQELKQEGINVKELREKMKN